MKSVEIFFSKLFTKEFIKSLFTPSKEDGLLFYWGFLFYIFINIWASPLLTLLIIAILTIIYQLIMYGYKDRKVLLRDFIFAFLPALYIVLATLLRNWVN